MAGMTHSIIPPLEEFVNDVEIKLGRANGNVYHRRMGEEGVHDGQIMVRLKKKRFVVLDYSIQPTEADFELAQSNPNIKIPKGAGREPCKTPDCHKVGVPVCIFDSEPDQSDSLYLRTGLCFNCQRNLNEKRRTERKRPSAKMNMMEDDEQPNLIFAIGPANKKFRYKNGATVELMSDAVIVNGAVEGTRHCGEGYGFQEIGLDLIALTREGAMDTDRLVHAVSTAGAVAAVGDDPTESHHTEAGSSVVDIASGMVRGEDGLPDSSTNPVYSNEDINTLYNKAFQSLNKSIFLLTQWKTSWDAAIAAAHETVADPTLADAVASAAAMVAAAATSSAATPSDSGDPSSANMVSLLLAADKRKEDGKDDDNEHFGVEAAYHVENV